MRLCALKLDRICLLFAYGKMKTRTEASDNEMILETETKENNDELEEYEAQEWRKLWALIA